ncbi:MAG TPA: DUF4124 domain-containing protein [Steroidobacteraceae bacterium]|nr:DUF4124 domain-containing protein [Steroidobacteraceae bacterium]
MKRPTTLAAALLAAAALQAHAINKCIDARGRVSYVEGACPAGSRQEKVTVMPGPQDAPQPSASPGGSMHGGPAPKRAPAPDTALISPSLEIQDPRMDAAIRKLATYEACEAGSPDFAQKGGPGAYQQWRAQNAQWLDRLPHSAHYMKILAIERQRASSALQRPETRQAFLESCLALAQPPR